MANAAVTLGTLRNHMDVVVPYFLAYCNGEHRSGGSRVWQMVTCSVRSP